MSIVVESVTLRGREDDSVGSTLRRYNNITLSKSSGNDRLVVVLAAGRRGAIRTLNSLVLDPDVTSTAGVVFQNFAIDAGSGQACSTAIAYFNDAQLPASPGVFDVALTWDGDLLSKPVMFIELSGVDQTTPLSAFVGAAQEFQTEGSNISATLSGEAGSYAFSYLAIADESPLQKAKEAIIVPSGLTYHGLALDDSYGSTSSIESACVAVASVSSVASASELYEWTYDFGGANDMDAIVTGVFVVTAAGGGGFGSGSGVTVTTSLEPINITTLDSLVALDQVISALPEPINLLANNADVLLGVSVNGSVESIQLTPGTSTVSANKVILSGIESIDISSYQSLIAAGSYVGTALESLLLSMYGADVSAKNQLSAGFEDINISTFQAGVTTASSINIQSESISLGMFLAVISANTSINGVLESIGVTAFAGIAVLGSAINAEFESINVQMNSATIRADFSLNAELESIVLNQLASQVSLSSHLSVALESLTLTPNGTTIVFDNGLSASIESLVLTPFNAAIVSPVTGITIPGLQYRIIDDRLHYVMPVNRLHYTFKR